jgi:hypothetical protein
MKTLNPDQAAKMFVGLLRREGIDVKKVAERRWKAPLKAPRPQQPCDIGLFGDDHLQLDLVEMLQDPTNGE